MRTFKSMLFVLGLSVFAIGCAPDEEELCEHLQNVYADRADDRPNYVEDIDSCIEYYEGIQKRHGVNSYRREAECLLGVNTVYKIRTCEKNEEKRRFE